MGIFANLVIVLSVATACQSKVVPALPKPNLTGITTFDPPGFSVTWGQVKSDERTPITGLKVKVWEREKEAVEKSILKFPRNAPVWTRVLDANATEATFENIKVNEEYEIRIQAFSDGGDGPYSDALGIKLHGDGA